MAEVIVNVIDADAVSIPRAPQEVRVYPMLRHHGRSVVSDHVSRAGVMGSYRIYLLDRETGEQVGRTVSAQDGSYSFENLRAIPEGFLLVAIDNGPKAEGLNAAVADLITPELPL